jgi:hypothetical protein
MSRSNARVLKRLLLLFWAIWLTLVTTTNTLDALKTLKVLPAEWPMASGNYRAVVAATKAYAPPPWVNPVLFGAATVWEAVAAGLFWLAWYVHGEPDGETARNAAFIVSLGLWGAFIIAEEVLIVYTLEAVHLRLLTAQLATLLVLTLVPEQPPGSG